MLSWTLTGTGGAPAVSTLRSTGAVQRAAGEGRRVTPGILPFALRVSLRLFNITPGDFVSLHAGYPAARHERLKRERLCRYITRPAITDWCTAAMMRCSIILLL